MAVRKAAPRAGVRWGRAGSCHGPALVSLASGELKAAVFVAALLAAMALFGAIRRVQAKRTLGAARTAA